MAETQITRCPHCQTTFRIRLEQLAAAKGAVRCGSCLQVFKGADHLVDEKAKPTPAAKPATTTTAKAAAVKASPVKAKPAAAKKPVPVAAKATKPAQEKKAAPIKPKADEISFDDIPDQIADDPLEDFGIRQPDRNRDETFDNGLQLDDSVFSMQEGAKPSRYSLHKQSDDLEFDLTDEFNDDNFSNDTYSSNSYDSEDTPTDESWASSLMDAESGTKKKKTSPDDESWADELLNVDEDLIEDIDMSFTKENVVKEEDDFLPSLEDDIEDDQFHLGGHDEFEQDTVEIELSVASSVNDLYDEPLNLNKKGKKAHKVATQNRSSFNWLWLTGALAMMFSLAAQVGYFKFDTWSRHPEYRPAYAITCQLIGCQLPAIQDVDLMNTQHFMVRLHPEVEQALYIDTLLVNNASYQQPFPDLNLVFTGLENQVIASRSFKPKEYLAGELAGAKVMPLKVPIHIAIEIVNPGAEAVSYRIELAANH